MARYKSLGETGHRAETGEIEVGDLDRGPVGDLDAYLRRRLFCAFCIATGQDHMSPVSR